MCSYDNISGLRKRSKIPNISFFSSITKYIPSLRSRPHQTLAHVNSALNWQFKWVTQTEYDTQNSIRTRWISYSLLHKEPETRIEIAHKSNRSEYFHALSFSCAFTVKDLFVCYFADLLKQSAAFSCECSSCSTRQCLGGQKCCRFLGNAQG